MLEPNSQQTLQSTAPSHPWCSPRHRHRGDGAAGADLCQVRLGAAQGISSQGAAKTLHWPLHSPGFSTCRGSVGCKDKDRAALPLLPPRTHICTGRWLEAQQAGGQDKPAISWVIKHTENYYLKNFT